MDDPSHAAPQPHELDGEINLRHGFEKMLDRSEALIQQQEDIARYHLKGCPHFKTHEVLARRHLATLAKYRAVIARERKWLQENPAVYNGSMADDLRQLMRVEHIRSTDKKMKTDNAGVILEEQNAMLNEDAVSEGLTPGMAPLTTDER